MVSRKISKRSPQEYLGLVFGKSSTNVLLGSKYTSCLIPFFPDTLKLLEKIAIIIVGLTTN